MSDAQIQEAVNSIFDKYDKDKSGSLDKAELKKIIEDIFASMKDSRKITDDDAQKVLTAMDKDKDGTVSKAELVQIIKRLVAAK